MKHTLRIVVMALSLSSVLVLGGPARPAHALAPPQVLVPVTVGGSATLTGGTVAACLSVVGCPAVAATVATAALAYGGYRLIKWAWGSDKVVEQPTPMEQTTTTSFGQGCWEKIMGSGSVETTYTCTSSTKARPEDQIVPTHAGLSFRTTILAGGAEGTMSEVKVRQEWSGGLIPTDKYRIVLYCMANSTTPTATSLWGTAAAATGATSGSIVVTFGASTCSGTGNGIKRVQFIADNTGGSYSQPSLGHYKFWGTPQPITSQPAPSHKWRGVKVCSGSGGTVTSYSASFKEADAELPALPNPDCPAGSTAVEWRVYEGDAAGAGGPQVLEWIAPSTITSPTTEVSDCLAGGSAYPCSVHLLKWTGSPAAWVECSSGINCDSFDPETSVDTEYQCRWASVVVALADCTALTTAPTNTQNPTTGSGQGPQDLETSVDPDVEPSLVEDESNTNCVGGVSWNPINWVVKPVKCALVWAFKPRQDHLTEIQDAYAGSVVQSLADPVTAISGTVSAFHDSADVGEDCHGPSVQVPLPGSSSFTFEPLNSCEAPASTAAAATKTALSFVFLVLGGIAVARIVLGAFGFEVFTKKGDTA